MAEVCEVYWPPIYAYLRRAGHPPADAKDLTQGFFAHLLEKDFLRNVQQQKGKFRSYLLVCLKNYTQNIRNRNNAQKRGGGQVLVSFDELQEEEHRHLEPAHWQTPEQAFEARWAETLMQRVIDRLRKVYLDAGKGELFDQLKDVHPGDPEARNYAEMGRQTGLSEGAIKTAVHRMRRRYRDLVRSEIASTLGNLDEVEEELRHLRQALSR